MRSSIQKFLGFAAVPFQGFKCCIGGSRASQKQFLARVSHFVAAAPSPSQLDELINLISPCPADIAAFYTAHNGAVLFKDSLSDVAALELLPISKMRQETVRFRQRYKDALGMLCDQQADEMKEQDWLSYKTAIAIAVSPYSANYFVVPSDGQHAGKVCQFVYEEWLDTPFVDTFSDFLEWLMSDPATLVRKHLGGHTRYTDGRTPIQWVPVEYVTGDAQPALPADVPASGASPLRPGRG